VQKLVIRELNGKQDVDSIFLVKHLAVMEGKDGKSYLNVILSDSSGDLEARKWHGAQEVFQSLNRGELARVQGKTNIFQGRLQLIINQIYRAPEKDLSQLGVSLQDYTPKAATPSDEMLKDLMLIVEGLDDVYIRDLLRNILFDSEIHKRLKVWYAGKSVHHAYEAGLLEHILSCARLAVTLSRFYNLNGNYVVAGAILHDLCKVYEMTEGPMVDYTDEGKLVGHLVKGVELIDHYTSRVKNFPAAMKMHLKHIVVSHHGEFEYGSPKLPATAEAYLVHLIDLMDSKINSMEQAKKADKTPGHWTGMIKHLERTIFKSELPYYKDYIEDQTALHEHQEVKNDGGADKRFSKEDKRNSDGSLKQNLASKLEGFKLNQSALSSSDEE